MELAGSRTKGGRNRWRDGRRQGEWNHTMPATTETTIRPTLHHVNFKTTHLQEMVDWNAKVLGAKVSLYRRSDCSVKNY
jgi:hypothetical protein